MTNAIFEFATLVNITVGFSLQYGCARYTRKDSNSVAIIIILRLSCLHEQSPRLVDLLALWFDDARLIFVIADFHFLNIFIAFF